jgi:hypothetical protein
MGVNATDAFQQTLIAAGRIPVVTHTVLRMQSDAIKNPLMVSSPGPGNNGVPTDPGLPVVKPLPECPIADPTCRGGEGPAPCDPSTDPNQCRPIGCAMGDSTCDPGCGTRYCCIK